MLSAKQGGIGYHFYRVFGMTRLGARIPNLPVSGRTLYHKATEPVQDLFLDHFSEPEWVTTSELRQMRDKLNSSNSVSSPAVLGPIINIYCMHAWLWFVCKTATKRGMKETTPHNKRMSLEV